jgi:hypothetical protein
MIQTWRDMRSVIAIRDGKISSEIAETGLGSAPLDDLKAGWAEHVVKHQELAVLDPAGRLQIQGLPG